MKRISPIERMEQTFLAVKLIKLGARMQLLETELDLSREVLLDIYHEVLDESPPKGMLPYVDEWYYSTWQPCIHSSLFMAYYRFFDSFNMPPLEHLIRAYEHYMQEVSRHRNYNEWRPVFSITRAWMMLKKMKISHPTLQMIMCGRCGGAFVTSVSVIKSYVCGFCNRPSRAGKTEKVKRRYL